MTSYLFPEGRFSIDRLKDLGEKVGKDKLVVDISCRKREGGWVVAMNGWKTLTDTWVNQGTSLSPSPCLPFHSIAMSSIPSYTLITLHSEIGDRRTLGSKAGRSLMVSRKHKIDRGSLFGTSHSRCRCRRSMSRDR